MKTVIPTSYYARLYKSEYYKCLKEYFKEYF